MNGLYILLLIAYAAYCTSCYLSTLPLFPQCSLLALTFSSRFSPWLVILPNMSSALTKSSSLFYCTMEQSNIIFPSRVSADLHEKEFLVIGFSSPPPLCPLFWTIKHRRKPANLRLHFRPLRSLLPHDGVSLALPN